MSWRAAASYSLIATLVTMASMFWARAAFQVRTLPERVMEWLLLFVPPDVFEKGIQNFGPLAKVLALYGAIAVMSGTLLGLGILALRRRWPANAILGLALALYAVVMAGIMPLTGAGFFATALLQHPVLVNGAYLGLAVTYASALLAGQAHASRTTVTTVAPAASQSRRALVGGIATAGGAYLLAWRQASIAGGTVASSLPLAQVADGGAVAPPNAAPPTLVATPSAHPGMGGLSVTSTPEAVAPATAVAPTAMPAPTLAPEPTVPPPPALAPAPTAPPRPTDGPAPLVPTRPPLVPEPTAPPPPTLAPEPTALPAATLDLEPTAPPPPTLTPEPTTPPRPTVTPAPTATPDTAPLPMPAPARQLARDKDGALSAATRVRGDLAALVTPIQAHYVVTKNAAADPALDADTWRLVVDGEVNRPVQVDYRTLRQLPAVELHKTLECISNFTSGCEMAFFGCDLISTALWKGARMRDVLDLAGGLKPGVVSLQMQGADEFSSSIPPQLALDPESVLAYEMNGQVLPRQHGYPVRLIVPGRYGMKNAKWVVGMRALRTEHVDWYGQRNWSRTGIVKTTSRIDVPGDGARLPTGRHRIAGVAYAGDGGVMGVQFSSDGGRRWNPTVFLEPALGRDTWVRWEAEFDVVRGQKLTLTSRAFDGRGQVQSAVFRLPQPDGGSGLHSIEVTGDVAGA